MAQAEESSHLLIPKTTTRGHLIATISRWSPRRKVFIRRRKLPSVRLGGKRKSSRGTFLLNVWRKMRLRWLKLQYSRVLKKLREHYRKLIKDIVDAGATLETFQQRILMETTYAVPVMGVSFNSFPSVSRTRAVS